MTKFTGIENPYAIGAYGVEQNAKVIQRYRFIHERLMFLQSGQLPARQNWDLKVALGRHIYEDSEAANMFRDRVAQLRTPSAALGREPDAALALLMDELLHAQNDFELVVGIYEVLRPALLATYVKHMKTTQQIVDQPTIRILRQVISDLEEQISWGAQMLDHLRNTAGVPRGADEFKENLISYLNAAGGVDGLGDKATTLPWRLRSKDVYQLPMRSVRDAKMGPTTWARTSVANPPADPVGVRVVSMMRVRQEEMTAAELIAGVMFSQKNMPWEFYYDLARHLWDEVRHCLFGQAALEADNYDWASRPQYTSDYDVNIQKIPSAQYAWLSIGIEEGGMKRTGKRAEYEFCRDQAAHPLMTQFQDYDWADEVVHANFGRKWTPELFGEDIEFVRQIADTELAHFWETIREAQAAWQAEQETAAANGNQQEEAAEEAHE